MGCTSSGKDESVILDNLEFTFEGPLTPGANTVQVEINTNEQILKPAGITLEQVQKVNIQNVHFTTDSTSFENVNSLELEAVSDKSEMKSIAAASPLNTTEGKIQLNVEESLDLKPYLSESVFYLLVDAEFIDSQATNKTITGNITLTLTTSQK